jgi:hypothetical protein
MSSQPIRVSPGWLELREPADARARASALVEVLHQLLPSDEVVDIHDLGSGTGSMMRWLAPRLTTAQHWILYDRDPALLELSSTGVPRSADDRPCTVESRQRDITRLEPHDLAGACLITASALLDMFTADELNRFVESCTTAGCPVLLTISVIGRVDLDPVHPLDQAITEAFNTHQRRTVGTRTLLGPDAVAAAHGLFTGLGFDVITADSPWQLGPMDAPLIDEWLAGWVGAACDERPGLCRDSAGYREQRLSQSDSGHLRVTVHHHDLLAVPG